MKTEPNSNAYPVVIPDGVMIQHGLTKREYFAAMAMQGIISNSFQASEFRVGSNEISGTRIAECAVRCADKLISELNKENV